MRSVSKATGRMENKAGMGDDLCSSSPGFGRMEEVIPVMVECETEK